MGAIQQALLGASASGPPPTTLRFYFPSTGASDVNPAFDAGWDRTADADRRKCVTTRISSADTRKLYATLAGAGAQHCLNRQYVSAPLEAGSLSGTVKGQVRCGRAAGTGTLALTVRVVSNDGSTFRGTAISLAASQLTSQPPRFVGNSVDTNRRMLDASDSASISLSTISVQAGDRLVIELGARELESGGGVNNTMPFSDNQATDLAEDDASTSAFNPWIEFSSCPPLQ